MGKTRRHFFKPILPTFHQKLSIPKSFMAYLKREKSDGEGEAILKSENLGKSWLVMVEGRNFQKGWKEFAREHHLCVGDFLVFQHQGGMVFHVKVFDYYTTCQREYSVPMQDGGMRSGKRKREWGDEKERKKLESKKRVGLTSAGTPALSISCGAPYFTVKLQQHDVHYRLYIPAEFAISNDFTNRNCTVTFKNEQGIYWKIKLNQHMNQVFFGHGWAGFLKNNMLTVGDICTFKLVSTGKNVVFEVTIFHSNGVNVGSSSSGTQLNWSVEEKEEEEAPCFVAKIQRYNFTHGFMIIPAEYVSSNGLRNRCAEIIILKDEEGKSWNVMLKHGKKFKCNKGQVFIGSGLTKFLKDNRLQIGNICTFKLISTGENVIFKFTISRSKGGQHL